MNELSSHVVVVVFVVVSIIDFPFGFFISSFLHFFIPSFHRVCIFLRFPPRHAAMLFPAFKNASPTWSAQAKRANSCATQSCWTHPKPPRPILESLERMMNPLLVHNHNRRPYRCTPRRRKFSLIIILGEPSFMTHWYILTPSHFFLNSQTLTSLSPFSNLISTHDSINHPLAHTHLHTLSYLLIAVRSHAWGDTRRSLT
jgi:hypothetical protein